VQDEPLADQAVAAGLEQLPVERDQVDRGRLEVGGLVEVGELVDVVGHGGERHHDAVEVGPVRLGVGPGAERTTLPGQRDQHELARDEVGVGRLLARDDPERGARRTPRVSRRLGRVLSRD